MTSRSIFTHVFAVASLALAASPAAAQTVATVAWSTYLRAAPTNAARVLDEVEHDSRVTRLACADGWCRVSQGGVAGYIDQAALTLPAPPAAGGADCVTAKLADDLRDRTTRLCGPAPATGH